ncbi:MAG: hypothetical protein A3J28_02160 [Acidobacteria bacterium RIFCSPLOWO2_12_FULL_60_22]|nr:MAG: hypothetical protein A3J28_02160 [Acidobacteria bacterium RIFCSPLOWO2_12_FULL_60_22]
MNSKQSKSSRRRFLKQGAALAGLAAVGGIRPARGQFGQPDPRGRTEFVPDESVPQANILRDPWTGEMLRDSAGDLVVDWTGTPQWEAYRKNIRAVGGPRYGALEKDSRLYGVRSRFVTTHRLGIDGGGPTMPSTTKHTFFSILSPVEAQLGIITPNGLHFIDEHGEVPEMDPRQHRLTISGMVDRPLTFTMEELMALPSVSRIHTVECNSDGMTSHRNRIAPWATAGDVYGELSCSEWTGVLLSKLLEMVGVKRGAKWFYASAADGYNQTWSIPMWKALDDTIIAYGQNGEPVRPEQGFPLRLLLPGFCGTMNIKRLRRIKITDELTLFHRMYNEQFPDNKMTWFRFEMPPKSCILHPSGGQQLTRRGFYEIRGIAWSGGGKITKVEVTVDGGKTWKDAEVQGPVHSKAHTRFVFPWSWNGEEVIIASRCTDERGSTQPTTAEFARFKGVDVDTLKARGSNRINITQPWKIDREGRITNAVYSI